MRRFERLESRLCPAVAAFQIECPESVEVGDEFAVEIRAREYHPYTHGLGGVAVDVEFDADLLEVLAWDVSEHLPLFNGGTIDNEAGTITNLRGACFPATDTGRPIGNLVWETFATITVRAEAPGAVTLTMEQGGAAVTTVPVSNLTARHLDFEAQTIEIVGPFVGPAETPPGAEGLVSARSGPGSGLCAGELLTHSSVPLYFLVEPGYATITGVAFSISCEGSRIACEGDPWPRSLQNTASSSTPNPSNHLPQGERSFSLHGIAPHGMSISPFQWSFVTHATRPGKCPLILVSTVYLFPGYSGG